jgi:hypothetical protein
LSFACGKEGVFVVFDEVVHNTIGGFERVSLFRSWDFNGGVEPFFWVGKGMITCCSGYSDIGYVLVGYTSRLSSYLVLNRWFNSFSNHRIDLSTNGSVGSKNPSSSPRVWDRLGYSFDTSLLLREEALTGVIAAADTAVKGGGEVGDLRKDCTLSSSLIIESSSSSKSFSSQECSSIQTVTLIFWMIVALFWANSIVEEWQSFDRHYISASQFFWEIDQWSDQSEWSDSTTYALETPHWCKHLSLTFLDQLQTCLCIWLS